MSVGMDLMINFLMEDTVYLHSTIFHILTCYMHSCIRQVLITDLLGQMFVQTGGGLEVFVFILVVSVPAPFVYYVHFLSVSKWWENGRLFDRSHFVE